MASATNDLRLVRVPEARHPVNSTRPVYKANDQYPRVITSYRAPAYMPKEGEEEWKPLGYIPQVEHTYAYLDQDFGIINQKQLVLAETTLSARTVGWPLGTGYGYNMMCMEELTKIAMERCDSARCAVKTMGDLAVRYGYFSLASGTPDKPSYGSSAEAAAVGDRYGEVWLFHVLTGPGNASAVWAAQRVPDSHVSVMANAMVIRQMDLGDPDNFLASDNVHSFAIEQGWWDPAEGPFDFTAAYAQDTTCVNNDWEFNLNALYSGRRHWRVFDLLAPSLELDSTLGHMSRFPTYPVSVEPDRKDLTPSDIMAILRDTYEGTAYDLSAGIKGGPFSAPLQFDPSHYANLDIKGGWERPIATYRMLFSFVAVARSWLPDPIGGVVWYGQSRSTTTAYVPFYAGHEEVPESYLVGLESEMNFGSSWWAFSFVSNLLSWKWSLMFPDVKAEQQRFESMFFKKQPSVEEEASAVVSEGGEKAGALFLQEYSNNAADEVTKAWWGLAWKLVAKYSTGYITVGESAQRERPGYPEWWLKVSGYEGWPFNTFKDPRSADQCDGEMGVFSAGDRTLTASAEKAVGPAAAGAYLGDLPMLNLYHALLFGAFACAMGWQLDTPLGGSSPQGKAPRSASSTTLCCDPSAALWGVEPAAVEERSPAPEAPRAAPRGIAVRFCCKILCQSKQFSSLMQKKHAIAWSHVTVGELRRSEARCCLSVQRAGDDVAHTVAVTKGKPYRGSNKHPRAPT
eukprot:CAMPEP_0177621152 /NCGR_PEP_ID=MMETSP0419_2-20121207/27403_1 /TAXON_ID=582737 /ORGANISM="Tetraselmis sp., Strain GSL018" /LENGTH=739 /DNA_ID=CAMNT_0019120991 /DNA_START=548 /DNA_END=2765 /DNA_ORIENTATION=-